MDRKICSIKNCGRKVDYRGLCTGHARRKRLGKESDQPLAQRGGIGEWQAWKPTSQGYMRRHRRVNKGIEWQYEHRVMMEAMIGRPLLPHENVHHVNGQRGDNRPENLELWSKSQPAGQRVPDKLAWAQTFLESYGYSVQSPPELD
jgi:hypothetical protein